MKKLIYIKRASITLILISIAMLLYPIIFNFIADQKRSVAVTQYDMTVKKMAKEHREQYLKQANEYNRDLFELQNGKAVKNSISYKDVLNFSKVIGKLTIPAISIKNMPFFHGTDPSTLEMGLGHLENTSIPIGGKNTHAVITGHSGVQNQKLFSDINKLQKDDVFYVTVLEQTLMYKIKKIQEIDPSDVDKVRIEPGKDKVTLLTCTPPGINTKRLLVTGYREIPEIPAKKLKYQKRDFWTYEHIVIMLLVLLALIILASYLIKRRKARG